MKILIISTSFCLFFLQLQQLFKHLHTLPDFVLRLVNRADRRLVQRKLLGSFGPPQASINTQSPPSTVLGSAPSSSWQQKG
ncbi:hypothetical protein E2C01_063166 [Portunus trituberculatus]|uniref:Secreted protein n=1 Tax=Portunus trituberculatus TaxID=210409 RepID=A0A5B7HFM3_PORTR|nr:hypothetical protein [Portunus trituberculatus]